MLRVALFDKFLSVCIPLRGMEFSK